MILLHCPSRIIFHDEKVLLLGVVQSLLESCMYIFVFLWTPVLDTGSTPLGMVFSCFMVCIMVGSAFFSILSQRGMSEAKILKVSIFKRPSVAGAVLQTASSLIN